MPMPRVERLRERRRRHGWRHRMCSPQSVRNLLQLVLVPTTEGIGRAIALVECPAIYTHRGYENEPWHTETDFAYNLDILASIGSALSFRVWRCVEKLLGVRLRNY